MTVADTPTFPALCRQWRTFRKLSQLELALEADVSQRHVSWLETGRSSPSREMVERLSEAMEIPLRERNLLLSAAGFSPRYTERALDEPSMAAVLDAIDRILGNHEPLPALVVDRYWNIKRLNRAAERMFSLVGDLEQMSAELMEAVGAGSGEPNLALLSLHPRGLRPFIANWDAVAPPFVRRLRSEAALCGDRDVQAHFERLLEFVGPVDEGPALADPLLPVLPLELSLGDLQLSLFTVISTIGTPMDVTADELRIEAFYPTDEETEAFFRSTA